MPGDRIGGRFDSIDCKIAEYQSTLPGLWRPSVDLFDLNQLYGTGSRPSITRFSAIAQVGFQYALGSNNTQRAQVSYTQALTASSFLQMDYIRRSTSGAIRNSSYESNYLDVHYLLRRSRYSSVVKLLFEGSDRSLSGGVLNDTVDPDFELIFSAVRQESASVFKRSMNIDWENYLSFTRDSLLKTGLYLNPHYRIANRKFTEINDFDTLYGYYHYDSLATYDRWERSEIGSTAGYFFHSQHFSVNGGFKASYWDFDNRQFHTDTLETAIVADALLTVNEQLGLKGNLYYNLFGAFGEKAVRASAYYTGKILQATVNAEFSESFPQLYQRHLYGNQYTYSWTNRQLITAFKLRGTVHYKNRIAPLTLSAGISNYDKFPFFADSLWRQDTLTSLSFTDVSLRADFRLKRIFFQPSVRVQSSNVDYVPAAQLFGRLGFDGYLFKAKKLRAAIGIEGGYITSFRLLDFEPFMDTYILPKSSTAVFQAMPKLHFFSQFELGFLRWFIRVENIEQVFIRDQRYEAVGYPVVPMQFRLGISWDIFN